jgi:hypothetical protein
MPATLFPCIEQPVRVTLHCSNGYYVWGLRKGRVIARKRRSEKDEWRLEFSTKEDEQGIVMIHNHKFGGTLSVTEMEEKNGTKRKMVCCVMPPENKNNNNNDKKTLDQSTDNSNNGTGPAAAAGGGSSGQEQLTEDANASEIFEDEVSVSAAALDNITEEDKKWYFIRGAHGGNEVMLKSLKTGETLGVNANGNILLTSNDSDSFRNLNTATAASTFTTSSANTTITTTWMVECVTGELCFLSNPALDSRLRCDMAGLLSVTDAWKGWEVFRIMETSHHYVKISSWMHSQWFLCSTADGTVTCCSHSESLLGPDNPKGCAEWAIEKSTIPAGPHEGVIIRSRTFGRFLSVRDGELRTYKEGDTQSMAEEAQGNLSTQSVVSTQSEGSSGNWWNRSSMTQMTQSVNSSMRQFQKRLSSSVNSSFREGDDPMAAVLPEKDTIVWQLESAHLQTYYFSNIIVGETPKTIGPFPQVTPILRKTDKIQLIRSDDNATMKLFHTEKKQYLLCTPPPNSTIVLDDEGGGDNADWIMEKPSEEQQQGGGNGSVFRSKLYNLYLSYEDISGDTVGTTNMEGGQTATPDTIVTTSERTEASLSGHFSNLFGNTNEKIPELMASPTIGKRELWSLEPCMPRAVSSEKIKTFAIGTGIAVGTTVAMPFALAGVGAIMGAVGAEVGVVANVIFAGLTGAEALASVGAIGATAYIVFRPEENSLTDDHSKKEEEEERAWSKRPFSNWRNW